MPGLAKTRNFMLGTATVMLGPQADMKKLNVADHSIGLVKNFSLSSEPGFTELTQGVRNTIVDSINTSNPVRATMEAFEYTASNMAYALGLDGGEYQAKDASSTVTSAVTGDDTEDSIEVATGDGSNFSEGDVILIDSDGDDNVIIRRVAGVETDTITVDVPFAQGQTIAQGATVKAVNEVPLGFKGAMPYVSAKIVGRLANNEPVVVMIPKLRVVRGFTLAFGTDDYGNMPLEFTLYDLVSSDPFATEFGRELAKVYRL